MATRVFSASTTSLIYMAIAGVVFLPAQALAIGPEITKDEFPDYNPAHTVIKCPYLPPDLVDIPLCNGEQATCVGTDGHDLILGSEANDIIVAGAGNDVVHSDALDDTVCGGPGDDTLFGARGNDTLLGGPGDDWLFGAVDPNSLDGGPGNFDVLWGGPNPDFLDGNAGTHDLCMLQMDEGDYDETGCNTAIRAKDVCLPASFEAPSVLEAEQETGE